MSAVVPLIGTSSFGYFLMYIKTDIDVDIALWGGPERLSSWFASSSTHNMEFQDPCEIQRNH
jgi:hypothetical protein